MLKEAMTVVSGSAGVNGSHAEAEQLQPEKKPLVERFFTTSGQHPFEAIEWERRSAVITNEKGEVIFEQKEVEVPKGWSQMATNVVASKYFHGRRNTPEREGSVRQLLTRVTKTIAHWGLQGGYFSHEAERELFEHELLFVLVHQMASFNSPVWFNCGIEERPQCSACFINSVSDTMESILDLAKIEGMLFKWGSGTGTNLSTIRSSKEPLSAGGIASGPVSFMKGYDSFAGVIKSGGKTRRAAKMVILNADHADVVEFINCKAEEEKKAWALIESGYDASFNGIAYGSIFFQNSNNSVRVTDDFMRAVVEDGQWQTRAVTTGAVMDTYRAKDLMRQIAEATHVCGDPGLQFDTTINDWNPCPDSGRINASNPCSEYMFLDDSACNLASLNLMKFRGANGEFDSESFCRTVSLMITAQEIIVGNASYPTPAIAQNSYDFRPLGLGYANLGALLMAMGLPYDSEGGRAYGAAVTALMTGQAYQTSALLAERVEPFRHFETNREPFLRVIKKHAAHVQKIDKRYVPEALLRGAAKVWYEAYECGSRFGLRNAQATVLAPTGTIAFMMDCDTTGVEPDIALVKYKKLVGGGVLKIINHTVPLALQTLGYNPGQIKAIVDYIDRNDTIEGGPELKEEHLPIFDCAFKPFNGVRSIHPMGHIKMMAAIQPFISGAISKTVNMPKEVTVQEIMETYLEAWRLGLKAIAIYRDGCKRTQPLNTHLEGESRDGQRPKRRRLPDERSSITHKFSIAGHEGYLTVGLYEDGTPGELFLVMAKEGSVVSGLADTVATVTSIALQYGVPLEVLVNKFSHTRFEPSGFTNNGQIPIAKSVMDYVFRWLGIKFLNGNRPAEAEERTGQVATLNHLEENEKQVFFAQSDAPPCSECGAIMVRSGACYKCLNCGATYGCS